MLIQDKISIASPPSAVWAVKIDVARWSIWSPTATYALSAGLPLKVGCEVLLKQPAQPKMIWRVTEFGPGYYFAWETSGKALRMRATYHITPHGSGAECVLTLKVFGSLRRIVASIIFLPIRNAIKQENRALKEWCESGRGAKS
ncbi:Polyketide cyclase / dehydrase and lipid transport [Jannaschia faecimaris]|uniref:Polyketide cyclase / dehydrase and lipid transport n=1 Tax=Jannaschia faecimaris TaxID=1244108 RepID=A0A1H3U7F0_9RHOB|nr:SRPBCC family protein [Jannaschia faecimaris]SDZ58207.1 Polyketide cyclase / dehydrase and lipid transport [Jannaschia faecimaris]